MIAVMKSLPKRGCLQRNEPMARHTSWRTGGPADLFMQPQDVEELVSFLTELAPGVAVHWIGLGSNLLVRDGGIRGAVICTAYALNDYTLLEPGRLRVAAGVPCAKVAKMSVAAGWTGAEFLIGIPGTMGGALAMNAGAFGCETWQLVSAVETIDRWGVRRNRTRDHFEVGYREVCGPAEEWFLAADLQLSAAEPTRGREYIKQLLKQRADSQPVGQPSCGSVFRNPVGDFAARLIEQCGLKGTRIGDAQVSEKHANFIVNLGAASADEIERLILQVRERVAAVHGIRLECEVKIVGEPAPAAGGGSD